MLRKQSWEEWYVLFLFHCDMFEGVQPGIACIVFKFLTTNWKSVGWKSHHQIHVTSDHTCSLTYCSLTVMVMGNITIFAEMKSMDYSLWFINLATLPTHILTFNVLRTLFATIFSRLKNEFLCLIWVFHFCENDKIEVRVQVMISVGDLILRFVSR